MFVRLVKKIYTQFSYYFFSDPHRFALYIYTGYNINVIAEHKALRHSPVPSRAVLWANVSVVFIAVRQLKLDCAAGSCDNACSADISWSKHSPLSYLQKVEFPEDKSKY